MIIPSTLLSRNAEFAKFFKTHFSFVTYNKREKARTKTYRFSRNFTPRLMISKRLKDLRRTRALSLKKLRDSSRTRRIISRELVRSLARVQNFHGKHFSRAAIPLNVFERLRFGSGSFALHRAGKLFHYEEVRPTCRISHRSRVAESSRDTPASNG